MSDFAENLRKAMFAKRLKGVDLANATKITPSVISRYLTGAHQPSTDNLLAISKYLGISPEALLSSSESPELFESSKRTPSDKDKIIAVQDKLIQSLQTQVMAQSHYINALFKEVGEAKAEIKELKEAKVESKERHTKRREQLKTPTKRNKPRFPA
mgnify:CR=1 FL=1